MPFERMLELLPPSIAKECKFNQRDDLWIVRKNNTSWRQFLKLVPKENEQQFSNLRSNAKRLRDIDNDRIVRIYDIRPISKANPRTKTWQGAIGAYILQEYKGAFKPLRMHILAERLWVPERRNSQKVARLAYELFEILLALKSIRAIHDDIHPSNVLAACDGRLMLIDFDWAIFEEDGRFSRNMAMGNKGFTSPDKLEGKPARFSDDLFSVISIICYCLTNIPLGGNNQSRKDIQPQWSQIMQHPGWNYFDADLKQLIFTYVCDWCIHPFPQNLSYDEFLLELRNAAANACDIMLSPVETTFNNTSRHSNSTQPIQTAEPFRNRQPDLVSERDELFGNQPKLERAARHTDNHRLIRKPTPDRWTFYLVSAASAASVILYFALGLNPSVAGTQRNGTPLIEERICATSPCDHKSNVTGKVIKNTAKLKMKLKRSFK